MPTPTRGYRLADGTRVPGTTTIIGRFKPSDGLIAWAWQLGIDGKDYRAVRDEAAGIGTLAHAMVERDILGHSVAIDGDPEMVAKATSAYEAYMAWQDQSKLEILETEMQLVSEQYRFGGTPDAVGKIAGKIVLVDWKTSAKVYSDHLIQLAAYGHLLEECRGYKIEGYHLCRFSKDNSDFDHRYFPDLSEAWRMFTLYREAYEIDKSLKKRAA